MHAPLDVLFPQGAAIYKRDTIRRSRESAIYKRESA